VQHDARNTFRGGYGSGHRGRHAARELRWRPYPPVPPAAYLPERPRDLPMARSPLRQARRRRTRFELHASCDVRRPHLLLQEV